MRRLQSPCMVHLLWILFTLLLIASRPSSAQSLSFSITSITPSTINPTIGETVTITYSVPATADYQIYIRNSSNATVRNLNSYFRRSAGRYSTVWDGKNNNKNVLTNGTYTVVIQGSTSGFRKRNITTATGLIAISTTPPPPPPNTVNSVATIIADMTLPNEDAPHGVPSSWDWAQGPVIQMGNNPGRFRAMTAWGQLYEGIEGNPATNTRVQLRDVQAYYLSRSDGRWHLLQNAVVPEGEAYLEDYSGDTNKPADIRTEPDGTISVKVGGGYNFHFWPPSRVTISPSSIAAIFTTCQARLIVADSTLSDDRASARYILDMGGDYWLNLTAQWAPNYQNNNTIASGRFKYVTSDWQAFNMTTATATQLQQYPPPLE